MNRGPDGGGGDMTTWVFLHRPPPPPNNPWKFLDPLLRLAEQIWSITTIKDFFPSHFRK